MQKSKPCTFKGQDVRHFQEALQTEVAINWFFWRTLRDKFLAVQTVGLHMETTGGHPDDRRESDLFPVPYVCIQQSGFVCVFVSVQLEKES